MMGREPAGALGPGCPLIFQARTAGGLTSPGGSPMNAAEQEYFDRAHPEDQKVLAAYTKAKVELDDARRAVVVAERTLSERRSTLSIVRSRFKDAREALRRTLN